MFISILISLVIILAFYYYIFKTRPRIPIGYKNVPIVKGGWPIIGHGLAFNKDIIEFVRNAYKQYGPIFRIKIFLIDMVVICDRKLADEFFKAKEDNFSLYGVLDRLFFNDAFSDRPNSLISNINMIKKTIAIKYDEFIPKIAEEANKLVESIKNKNSTEKRDMIPEMIKFVSRTSAKCFTSIDLSEEFFENLHKFTKLLNKIIVLTYFLPKWFLKMTLGRQLRKYRLKMTEMLISEIEKYRKDLQKKDSSLFRIAVDHIDDNGNKLNNIDIGGLIVCLLYISSENTSLSLNSALIDLARNPEYWEQVKNESEKNLQNKDYKAITDSDLLERCFLETVRLGSHVFALSRQPVKKNATIGNYFIGNDIHSIAICEPIMMKFECSTDVFENPEVYNPERYLEPRKEPMSGKYNMTFGSGCHACPGKTFSKLEVKIAISMLLTNFERFKIKDEDLGQLLYFSPSAMAERPAKVQFVPLNPKIYNINFEGKEITIENINNKGWLIRNIFQSIEERKKLYNYTIELSENSQEQKEILDIPLENPFPICFYNLVYTSKSNCEKPTVWLTFANNLWNKLLEHSDFINLKIEDNYEFDSIYAQLYGKGGYLKSHKDQFVSQGISISFGASCKFQFGDKTLILNDGDIFISDFSQTFHEVKSILDDTKPEWFSEENGVNTFGRLRMSIQIRSVKNCIPLSENLISNEKFKQIINA